VQVALQAALDNSTEQMAELITALTELALSDPWKYGLIDGYNI
jgi:hypothetical protein